MFSPIPSHLNKLTETRLNQVCHRSTMISLASSVSRYNSGHIRDRLDKIEKEAEKACKYCNRGLKFFFNEQYNYEKKKKVRDAKIKELQEQVDRLMKHNISLQQANKELRSNLESKPALQPGKDSKKLANPAPSS